MPKLFPASEGWIRATLTMTTAKPLGEEEIKRIVSLGDPEKYEWARVEQHGKKLKIIYRAKSDEKAAA